MKLVRSNGRSLEVRDVGDVVIALEAKGRAPLPIIDEMMSEEEARNILRMLIDSGFYERTK